MEDVLEVYRRPYDPQRPQVCLDEASKQILRDVRDPLPAYPGRPARVNYEYERGASPICSSSANPWPASGGWT